MALLLLSPTIGFFVWHTCWLQGRQGQRMFKTLLQIFLFICPIICDAQSDYELPFDTVLKYRIKSYEKTGGVNSKDTNYRSIQYYNKEGYIVMDSTWRGKLVPGGSAEERVIKFKY